MNVRENYRTQSRTHVVQEDFHVGLNFGIVASLLKVLQNFVLGRLWKANLCHCVLQKIHIFLGLWVLLACTSHSRSDATEDEREHHRTNYEHGWSHQSLNQRLWAHFVAENHEDGVVDRDDVLLPGCADRVKEVGLTVVQIHWRNPDNAVLFILSVNNEIPNAGVPMNNQHKHAYRLDQTDSELKAGINLQESDDSAQS